MAMLQYCLTNSFTENRFDPILCPVWWMYRIDLVVLFSRPSCTNIAFVEQPCAYVEACLV